jgi:hypothetical protein
MQTSILDSLRPFLSRILAPLISAVFTWLAVHYGINFADDTREQVIEALVVVIIPLAQIVNGVAHRVIDKKINPADTASTHLAQEGKAEVAAIKVAEIAAGE